MPTIRKQSPRRQGQIQSSKAAGGSAWDMLDAIRMLLYGKSGTGKTTFWATFPGPILALICSGGNKPGELRSINTPEYREKITPRIVQSTDQLRGYLAEAGDYRTVVVDHASGLQDLTLKEILGLEELPAQKSWGLASQQVYGQSSLMCKEIFRSLLNLPTNVVLVAQEKVFGELDGATSELISPTVGAALTPSVVGWLNPACDYVVQTFIRPKMEVMRNKVGGKVIETRKRGRGVEYCLRTEPHDVYTTKFRVPRGSVIPDCIVDPDYDKLLSLIRGEEVS